MTSYDLARRTFGLETKLGMVVDDIKIVRHYLWDGHKARALKKLNAIANNILNELEEVIGECY